MLGTIFNYNLSSHELDASSQTIPDNVGMDKSTVFAVHISEKQYSKHMASRGCIFIFIGAVLGNVAWITL